MRPFVPGDSKPNDFSGRQVQRAVSEAKKATGHERTPPRVHVRSMCKNTARRNRPITSGIAPGRRKNFV